MQQYLEQKRSLAKLPKRGIAQVKQLGDSHNLVFNGKKKKKPKHPDLIRKLIMVLGTQVSYYKG